MPLTLAVTWVAQPGNEARVAEILRRMMPLSRAEPGCLHYSAHQSPDDPRRFFLFEQYADEAAFAEHSASEHFQTWIAGEAIPLLASRERVQYTPL
jgi:autoinducer 2-degrading protein